ncbi:hypothetical protein BGX38DRAFT_845034 [Terfezia claveryi]|nr:hypothetical protein BGX38DRAFT_845034 [Terfezia claveryi]
MAEALVMLPFQSLGLDSDSCSTRGSFLADRPPVSSLSDEEIFKISALSDLKDMDSCEHSGTIISKALSRQSSLASDRSSASTSKMFLSLSASTRRFFGYSGSITTLPYSNMSVDSPSLDYQRPAQFSGTLAPPSSPRSNCLLSNKWSPMKEGCLPNEEMNSQIEDRQFPDSSAALFLQERPDTTATTSVSEGVISQMAYLSSTKSSQLSFTTGSLKFSRQSIITVKPQSIDVLDDATMSRMRKRRDLIEELLKSEEIYISELKTLLNVYFGTINDDVYPFTERKASFIRTIGGILDLHERLYQAMQNAIPCSFDTKQASWNAEEQLNRLSSPFNSSNPAAAALVANAFDEMMKDLLVYEDFISKYDAILKDGYVFRSNPHRRSWERDCEILSNSFLSKAGNLELTKRALTFEDLLMKPIQRICKYPLFFTELLRVTPLVDCPKSNAILDRVNFRVRNAVYQLDMAKENSPKVRERLERNWLLQKRLGFKDKLGPQPIQLGQVVLCGPLYACWRDSKAVQGDYYACLLYKSYLLLAAVSKSDSSLNVVLAISLVTARIEETTQGIGIQCHNAPFSWIVAFEHDFKMYEIVFCAWNSREEEVWRKSVEERISIENRDWMCDGSPTQRTLFVRPIGCNIEPFGSSGGYQGSLKRHWSFHGSVSLSPKVEPLIVSIQNTWASSEQALQPRTRSSAGLSRSSSVVNVNDILTLAPKRSTRSRLENALIDVWSKDQLPPGASSWLLGSRKFSMGSIPSMSSITSSFGRKSSQPAPDGQSPTRSHASEYPLSESPSPVKAEKRRSSSLERPKVRRNAEPSSPSKDNLAKEPKTPISPIWPSWGSSKGKETSSSINSPTLLGDKGTWKKKRWSNPGNVMRFFECDTSTGTAITAEKKFDL